KGWTVLIGNMTLYMVDDEALAKIAKKADVFQMILEGTSDTAGFTWGTGGKLVRGLMIQDCNVIRDEGKLLPEEIKAFADNDNEQAVLQMLNTLTVSMEELEHIKYQKYSFPEELMFG